MRFTLPFYKLCPGGNPTILFHDNALLALPAAARAAIATAALHADHLGADQAGFLDTSRALPHMEMMGGELCVNATRCAALVFALTGLLPEVSPGSWSGEMGASGIAGAVAVRVTEKIPGVEYDAAVALPVPSVSESCPKDTFPPGVALVRLPGITHLLLDARIFSLPPDPVAAAREKRAAYALDSLPAVGVIWHEPCGDTPTTRRILPVVHVAATQTEIRESACGSGSLALALCLARENGATAFAVRQPSGREITVQLEAATNTAWVGGPVSLTAQGVTHVCP